MGAVSFKVGRPGQGVNTLATAGFSDLVSLKVGTSLAKAGNKKATQGRIQGEILLQVMIPKN